MKYSNYIGILAAVSLVISCFLPWAWYPDIQKMFTGFFSEQNVYGRPGRALIFLAAVMSLFFILPKLWAKRANLFVGILLIAFGLKTFILFSACYRGTCPERQAGLFGMLVSCVLMLIAALLPRGKIKES
jgi:hypothetical protein